MGYYRARRNRTHYYGVVNGELKAAIMAWCGKEGIDRSYVDPLTRRASYDYDSGARFSAASLPSAMKEYMEDIRSHEARQ